MSVAEATKPAVDRPDPLSLVTPEVIEAFRRDGAVWIKGLLSPAWMQLMELGVKRNRNNPGPLAFWHFEGEPGQYWDDYCNYEAIPEYQRLLRESPIVDVMAKVLQTKELRLYADQVFVKEGGESRPTRWHQDTPYWVADGEQMATMWVSLDPLSESETLEVVAGSQHDPLYGFPVTGRGVAIDTPLGSNAPPTPDIDAERDKWPIISHASQPGDVLIFHPTVLHGGAGMREGGRRRSMSWRFIGDDARYVERGITPDPAFPGISESLKPGDPMRHSWFPLVYPRQKTA